jgi:hypothetical protein
MLRDTGAFALEGVDRRGNRWSEEDGMNGTPPELERPVCPGCGGAARPVKLKTVKHLLSYPLSRAVSGEGFSYCIDPECDVYYFRPDGTDSAGSAKTEPEVYRAADIKERARPFARGDERLVCHCFGCTVGDIADDARSTRNAIPGAIAAEVRAGMCACEVLNPGGG